MDWPFADDRNTACFTTAGVQNGSPILRVYHDYDADWQFHDDAPQSPAESEPKLVSLGHLIERDPTLATLHDLPYGWRAERESVTSQWIRHKNNPFPSYAEDGYYLEDALWLAGCLPDIKPPNAETRENLQPDQYVKLVFRFSDENSDREDNECERMWVRVTGVDDDGYYFGTIENDPNHDAASCGDSITFHPLHVADIYADE